MTRLMMLGVAAALALAAAACGDSDDGGEIPANIATILNQNCADCHGDPPVDGVPYPILTCNDVIAEFDLIQNRINNEAAPMPPDGLMADGPRNELNEWLDDGAPPCE